MAERAPENDSVRKTFEYLYHDLHSEGVTLFFTIQGGVSFTYEDCTHLVDTRQLTLGSPLPQDLEQAFSPWIERLTNTIPPPPRRAPISESSRMGAQKEDDGIPKVKFPPKPEGWKGDPGNPNFRALGTLSPPVMRKIEPAGPHFLAFARRVSRLNQALDCMLTMI